MKKFNFNKFFATIIIYVIMGIIFYTLHMLSGYLPNWLISIIIVVAILFHAISNAKSRTNGRKKW